MRDLARIRKCLTREAAITLSNALVSSRLDYCNSLLGNISAHDLLKLQSIQNRLARIVCKKSKYTSCSPLLKSLHWLPVKYRIMFKQGLLIYKTLHSGMPRYFEPWFKNYTCNINTRRSKPENKYLVTVKFDSKLHKSKKFFDLAFSVSGPSLWNSLPLHVRCCDTVLGFRKELKTYLFSLAFPP